MWAKGQFCSKTEESQAAELGDKLKYRKEMLLMENTY